MRGRPGEGKGQGRKEKEVRGKVGWGLHVGMEEVEEGKEIANRREQTNIVIVKVELFIPPSVLPGNFAQFARCQVTQQQGVGGVRHQVPIMTHDPHTLNLKREGDHWSLISTQGLPHNHSVTSAPPWCLCSGSSQ